MFGKGMEMMLINIIKSLGLDPNELKNTFDGLTDKVTTSLDTFDKRLATIDERLERIEREMNIEACELECKKQLLLELDNNDEADAE